MGLKKTVFRKTASISELRSTHFDPLRQNATARNTIVDRLADIADRRKII